MSIIQAIKIRIQRVFNLLPDKEEEATIIQSIRDDVEIKGARSWVLICAIFIASLGLNVNSTAVIIGAMLISPLMNPIVALGVGLAIYDLELVRKSFRSLLIMVLISITTATLYFLVSPLSLAQSELLARTQPTIYDVLIAIFGGIAGFLASGTKVKGNTLMGVAIATALMPPLCTAGYGLSQWSASYFFGASYLFMINTIFIALSTFLVARVLKFSPVVYLKPERERKIHRWIVGIVLCVALPSVYTGFLLVRESIETDSINRFVRNELNGKDYQSLRHHLLVQDDRRSLEVVLLGRRVDSLEVDSLQRVMQTAYRLEDIELHIRQDFMASKDSIDLVLSKELMSKELYQRQEEFLRRQQLERDSLLSIIYNDSLRRVGAGLATSGELNKSAREELVAMYPELKSCSLQEVALPGEQPMTMLVYRATPDLDTKSKERIRSWLKTRFEGRAIELHRL